VSDADNDDLSFRAESGVVAKTKAFETLPILIEEVTLRRLLILMLIPVAILACSRKASDDKKTAADAAIMDDKALFDLALKYESSAEYVKACELYQTIESKYPQSSFRYKAIFMRGFDQIEYLKNNQEGIRAFDLLLKDYPNCDLAANAKQIRDVAGSGRDLMSVFQESMKSRQSDQPK
jgi:hypothetical protein